jgi:hypothetical protein
MVYPTPQEEQLPAVQLPQAEDAADVVTWLSPPGPVDLDMKPHLESSRDKSLLSQPGQAGLSLPRTRVSNSFLQALHIYS